MKSEKEIQDQMDMHIAICGKYKEKLADEQCKLFPSRVTIDLLKEYIKEMDTAIVHLSWTLIDSESR